jgi:hypothetical protein
MSCARENLVVSREMDNFEPAQEGKRAT